MDGNIIYTNCYLSILKQCKEKNPKAHFEYINNRNLLAPSRELLHKFLPLLEKYKKGKISKKEIEKKFLLYSREYIDELENDKKKMNRIDKLIEILKERNVFLICYCKDSSLCHRTPLKNLILKIKRDG